MVPDTFLNPSYSTTIQCILPMPTGFTLPNLLILHLIKAIFYTLLDLFRSGAVDFDDFGAEKLRSEEVREEWST